MQWLLSAAVPAVPWLDQIAVPSLGAAGLLALAVFLILRGLLVPRSLVDQMIKHQREQIASITRDRDQWRNAYIEAERGRKVSSEQVKVLLQGVHATASVVQALPEVGEDEPGPEAR